MSYRAKCARRRERTRRGPISFRLTNLYQSFDGAFEAVYEGHTIPWWAELAHERGWLDRAGYVAAIKATPVQPSPFLRMLTGVGLAAREVTP